MLPMTKSTPTPKRHQYSRTKQHTVPWRCPWVTPRSFTASPGLRLLLFRRLFVFGCLERNLLAVEHADGVIEVSQQREPF